MFKEFKAFVNQGNALDLAVGVLIGAAFGKIVNSLVNDIVMPMLSPLLGRVDVKNLYVAISDMSDVPPGASLEQARAAGKAVIAYGQFINIVFEFFVVAFCIFLVVRQINRWRGTTPAKT
jgi:large conductance mechanosensitive channel